MAKARERRLGGFAFHQDAQLSARLNAKLAEDGLKMLRHCVTADTHLSGNLLIRHTAPDIDGNL